MNQPVYYSREKRIIVADEVTVGDTRIDVSAPPAKLKHWPELGVLCASSITPRRVWIDEFICHPRAQITPGGDFILFFPAGAMHYAWAKKGPPGNQMMFSRSSDRGRTWSDPKIAWKLPYSQHAAIPLVPRGSKRMYVFGTEPRHDVYDGVENAAIGYRTSDDDGHTWSDVTLLNPDFRGMSAIRMCETESGAWLLASHHGIWDNGSITTEEYLFRSEDQGKTWSILPGMPPNGWRTPGFHRMEEGRPIHLGNDRVLLMVRTPEGRLWEMRSEDAGRTWGGAQPTPLAHPDAPPMLFHLADGKTLIAFHHNRRRSGSMTHQHRAELWVSLSRDDGFNWTEPRLIAANTAVPAQLSGWEGSSPMVSYADLLVDGDDLHLFIDHQVRQVMHLSFRRQDIEQFPTAADLKTQP